MPIELLPNQPFIFEQVLPDQPCLNSDTNTYGQLVAPSDTICVQQRITPCNADIMCDQDMYEEGEEIIGAWTTSGAWSSSSDTEVAFDGAATASDECSQSWGDLCVGGVYRLSFDIASITGDTEINVQLGNDAGDAYTALGSYVVYLIPQTTGDTLQFVFNGTPTASETCTIENISFKQWVDCCWHDALNGDAPINSWDYSFNEDTQTGSFTKYVDSPTSDLINDNAYDTDDVYHGVGITITNCTTGYVEIYLGGEYFGQTYSNGEFVLYGYPNDGSLWLVIRPQDGFDGTVSNVFVDDYGISAGDPVYELVITNESGIAATDTIPYELNDDYITWCFNIDDIENGGNPVELPCDAENRILITAACPEQEPTEYLSVNTLRYDTNGWDCSYVVASQCEGYAFGFYFGSTTNPVFSLTQRLRILQFAPRYPSLSEEYLFSNGRHARIWAQSTKIRQAWVDYTAEYVHDVIRLQLLSDILTVDGDIYFSPVADYEPEWDEHRRNLAQSRFDLIKADELSLFNRSCETISQTGCPTEPVLPPVDCNQRSVQIEGVFIMTGLDPSNFFIYQASNDFIGTSSTFDVTGSTAAFKAFIESFITTAMPFGMGGTITSSSVVYNAGAETLTINIIGTGDVSATLFPFVFLNENYASYATNSITSKLI